MKPLLLMILGTLSFSFSQSAQANNDPNWQLVHWGECLMQEVAYGYQTGVWTRYIPHWGPDTQTACLRHTSATGSPTGSSSNALGRPTVTIACQTVNGKVVRLTGDSELAASYVNGRYRYNIQAVAYGAGTAATSRLKGYVEVASESVGNKTQLATTMELSDAESTLPRFMFRYVLNQQYMKGKLTGVDSYGRFIET